MGKISRWINGLLIHSTYQFDQHLLPTLEPDKGLACRLEPPFYSFLFWSGIFHLSSTFARICEWILLVGCLGRILVLLTIIDFPFLIGFSIIFRGLLECVIFPEFFSSNEVSLFLKRDKSSRVFCKNDLSFFYFTCGLVGFYKIVGDQGEYNLNKIWSKGVVIWFFVRISSYCVIS